MSLDQLNTIKQLKDSHKYDTTHYYVHGNSYCTWTWHSP